MIVLDKQGLIEGKIDEIVEKAGYITEKMLIDLCIDENLPDYEIDQLCDKVFMRNIIVLETSVYVENDIVRKYAQNIQRNDKKNACKFLTSIVNFIACFQDDYFDSIVNEEKWEELVQLAKGRTSNDKFIKKYDFDKITVLNFIDYYKLFSIKQKRELISITDEKIIFQFLFEHVGFLYSDTIIANTLGLDVEIVDDILENASWVSSKWNQYYIAKYTINKNSNWKEEFSRLTQPQTNINDENKETDINVKKNSTNYEMIRDMDVSRLAKFLNSVGNGNDLFFEKDYEEENGEIDVTKILTWLKKPSVTPIQVVETKPIEEISKTQSETEGNPFWTWLKNEGFMERVINQLKEYTNSITNEAGLKLFDLKSENEIQNFIDQRGVKCPTKERLLYKYYIQYWKLMN